MNGANYCIFIVPEKSMLLDNVKCGEVYRMMNGTQKMAAAISQRRQSHRIPMARLTIKSTTTMMPVGVLNTDVFAANGSNPSIFAGIPASKGKVMVTVMTNKSNAGNSVRRSLPKDQINRMNMIKTPPTLMTVPKVRTREYPPG